VAGLSWRFRLVGHESAFAAARVAAATFVCRAGRGVVLRGLVFVVASAMAVAGCAAPGGLASRAATLGVSQGAFVAAVSGTGQQARRGLAEFSLADGRLLRWLVRSRRSPLPVAVSPDGRWVYFYYQAALALCPDNGFSEPVLWRVPVRGGRPRQAGLATTSIAFSPDGRMVARTSSKNCGRTVWIVVRNRRTGATRRIVLARNAPDSNNPIFSAQLSWAPDDRHLAVAVAPAAAINALFVINARRTTSISAAPPIRPCARENDECLDPGFDVRGRLTFLKWRNELTGHVERVMRWHEGRAIQLFRLSRDQSAGAPASIAADRTGNAVLLAGGLRHPGIWRWSSGHLQLVRRSTRQLAVASPLWLRHR